MELWEIHHQTPHEIEARHDHLLGLEPELMILHELVSDQDIYLHVRGVATWVVHIYCIAIFNPIHKLDIPMCGDFKSHVICCAFKILHGSNPTSIHLEYIQFDENYFSE